MLMMLDINAPSVAGTTPSSADQRLLSLAPPFRRLLFRLLQVPTAAEALPFVLYTIVTNAKYTALGLLAGYMLMLALWLPFWLLSFLITEWGIYFMVVGAVFFVGRAILRLIAFPASSQRVSADIEREFAKYSARILTAAVDSWVEVTAPLVTAASPAASAAPSLAQRSAYEMPGLWKHARMYRDRVLGVYLEVLTYLYEGGRTGGGANNIAAATTTTTASLSGANMHSQQQQQDAHLTRFGNNRLDGDIGNLSGLTHQARIDGRELLTRLQNVIRLIDALEQSCAMVLSGAVSVSGGGLSDQGRAVARELIDNLRQLRDLVSSLRPATVDEASSSSHSDDEDPVDSMRRRIDEQSSRSALEAVKTGLASILPMLDPPPHTCIFGFDVQRGCMLSRYRGARQIWVTRPSGGLLDVIHFPAFVRGGQTSGPLAVAQLSAPTPLQNNNPLAVLYCNPNAGLIEVATGMSLSGGNVPAAEADSSSSSRDHSWVDYYTSLGIDVFVFNYAGYGRSYGTSWCSSGRGTIDQYRPGTAARLTRIIQSCFFEFQPTTETLRADGVTVAKFLLQQTGVQKLIIHGESIGGVAAAGTGRYLSLGPELREKVALLVCDRTFCNLEAVAQRLVGGWTGYAIRALAPLWNTDVAGDFLAATCPKVVANDAADVIISDAASLKSGIALWKELRRGFSATKGLGWMIEEPLQYRMAEWENVCVADSRYAGSQQLLRAQPPVWPNDKHISLEEAFHFAACCKRIGKLATQCNRGMRVDEEQGSVELDEDGPMLPSTPLLVQVWMVLGTCDGLTGSTLGVAVKRGFDATVAWLCCTLIFGGQTLVAQAERRLQLPGGGTGVVVMEIQAADFDSRPAGYELKENEATVFPKPITAVIDQLCQYAESGDGTITKSKSD